MREFDKVLIVQPHSDDALFCNYSIIKGSKKVVILTVENNEKRIKEDIKLKSFFPQIKQIKTINSCLNNENSYYEYYKQNKRKDYDFDEGVNLIYELYPEFVTEVLIDVIETVADFYGEGYKLFVPLGIGHPFHSIVSKYFRMSFPDSLFYRDFPHSYKRKAKKSYQKILNIVDICFINEIDNDKWGIAKEVYRSQSSLFWFEQNYLKKVKIEEFYKLKTNEDCSCDF